MALPKGAGALAVTAARRPGVVAAHRAPGAAVPVLAGSGLPHRLALAFGARLGMAPRRNGLPGAVLCGRDLARAGRRARPVHLTAASGAGHRRCCAGGAVVGEPSAARRVRVERTMAAWPDIARARAGRLGGHERHGGPVGMAGAHPPGPWTDHHRRHREDTRARIGLGTFRGAVRVYPTPDDLANRCELRVLDSDPHADAIPWPGPSIMLGHAAGRTGAVRRRRRRAVCCSCAGTRCSAARPAQARAAASTTHGEPDRLPRRGHLGHRPQARNGTRPWAACIDRLATTPEQATALLPDAVTILQARAEHLAGHGWREWEPTPEMPALVIVIDEYAELAEQAPARCTTPTHRAARPRAGRDAGGRHPAPDPESHGTGRGPLADGHTHSFRVQEQRDVDLVLGQGMLKAGWHAHKLNAPGKFLVSSPEHDIPRRARAYLVTDEMVAETAALHSRIPRQLDDISRNAIANAALQGPEFQPQYEKGAPGESPEEALSGRALRDAPEEGWKIGDLMANYRNEPDSTLPVPRNLADEGRAYQVSRGRWRARTTRTVTMSDRPFVPPSRASARNGRDKTLELARDAAKRAARLPRPRHDGERR